jgi:hypothetical protein
MSRRGYTFNARTEKRKTFEAKVIERKNFALLAFPSYGNFDN